MNTLRDEIKTLYPDCFHQVQVRVSIQRLFIQLYHQHPRMTVVELARRSKLSRPTCYKLIRLLEERGDIRGQLCNGEPFLPEVRVLKSAGDLSHMRRVDLLHVIDVHEEYVKSSLTYLCGLDKSFREFRNDKGEVNMVKLIDFLRVKNEGRKRKSASQVGL